MTNLYIAGGSVFPTPAAMPTRRLPSSRLSLRLADHLQITAGG